MKRLLGMFVVLLIVAAGDAAACSCISLGATGDPVADAVSSAQGHEAVFRGKIVASELVLVGDQGPIFVDSDSKDEAHGYMQRIVVLRVEEVYRGTVAPLATVVTGGGGGDCGYLFEEGKEYLVYARVAEEERDVALAGSARALSTGICDPTQPAGQTKGLREALAKKYGARKPARVQNHP